MFFICITIIVTKWAIPEKSKQAGGVEDMEFPGIPIDERIHGSIKKEVKFPVVFKKNSCGSSMGLGF